jgi:hypothetical protein
MTKVFEIIIGVCAIASYFLLGNLPTTHDQFWGISHQPPVVYERPPDP